MRPFSMANLLMTFYCLNVSIVIRVEFVPSVNKTLHNASFLTPCLLTHITLQHGKFFQTPLRILCIPPFISAWCSPGQAFPHCPHGSLHFQWDFFQKPLRITNSFGSFLPIDLSSHLKILASPDYFPPDWTFFKASSVLFVFVFP